MEILLKYIREQEALKERLSKVKEEQKQKSRTIEK